MIDKVRKLTWTHRPVEWEAIDHAPKIPPRSVWYNNELSVEFTNKHEIYKQKNLEVIKSPAADLAPNQSTSFDSLILMVLSPTGYTQETQVWGTPVHMKLWRWKAKGQVLASICDDGGHPTFEIVRSHRFSAFLCLRTVSP